MEMEHGLRSEAPAAGLEMTAIERAEPGGVPVTRDFKRAFSRLRGDWQARRAGKLVSVRPTGTTVGGDAN